jgi:hypothetical protein
MHSIKATIANEARSTPCIPPAWRPRLGNWAEAGKLADYRVLSDTGVEMQVQNNGSPLERAYYFTLGLTVILVSYSATLLVARFFVTRL